MSTILRRIFLFLCILLSITSGLRAQSIYRLPGTVTVADMVIDEAMKYLGTPYRWGGKNPKGFDCAGFTRYIYSKFGVELAPSAAPQYRIGTVLKTEEICKGDLVFYAGRSGSKHIGHVGIVTTVNENGFEFIHAQTSTGVAISSSREPYYANRYIGACRVVDLVTSNIPANEIVEVEQATQPIYRQVIFVDTAKVYHPTPISPRPR